MGDILGNKSIALQPCRPLAPRGACSRWVMGPHRRQAGAGRPGAGGRQAMKPREAGALQHPPTMQRGVPEPQRLHLPSGEPDASSIKLTPCLINEGAEPTKQRPVAARGAAGREQTRVPPALLREKAIRVWHVLRSSAALQGLRQRCFPTSRRRERQRSEVGPPRPPSSQRVPPDARSPRGTGRRGLDSIPGPGFCAPAGPFQPGLSERRLDLEDVGFSPGTTVRGPSSNFLRP